FEAGGQQPGDAADVVDVHVGGDQGANAVEGEVDGQVVGAGAAFGSGFRALEQAAVDQQAVLVVHVELMAGASDAFPGAVVVDMRVQHGGVSPLTAIGGGHGNAGAAK